MIASSEKTNSRIPERMQLFEGLKTVKSELAFK
jgi:hypothetical protein